MLAVNVTITGDKVLIRGLGQFAADLPNAVERGLKKVVRGIHRNAMDFLNGAGGMNSYETRTSKGGKQYQKKTGSKVEEYEGFTRASGGAQTFKRFSDSGGYPVPVRTGNLKRLLDFLDPGQSKGSFTAGPMEVVAYNSAEYASAIHEGRGSSAKFGRRPFMDDALAKFNQGNMIATTLEAEINVELKAKGLA